jgi:hypothetical protein
MGIIIKQIVAKIGQVGSMKYADAIDKILTRKIFSKGTSILYKSSAIILSFAAVAQLDRVLGYEPRGRGFDSCQPHQI